MVEKILEEWLAEDVGQGDFTSESVIENSRCQALVSGGPGIVSGLEICKKLLNYSRVNYEAFVTDGSNIGYESSILKLEGFALDILRTERLLLNIISHLSGIATFTRLVVDTAKEVNPNVEVLATRKTIPGMRILEKEAVSHGGGQTHRLRLDDAILIKDNHLKLSSSVTEAVFKARKKHPELLVEVEADTVEQALEAANAQADRVMLDNFTPKQVETTVKKLKQISNIEIEVSGGINLDNIKDYSLHVDLISLSGLTMAAPPVNFSLHVI